MDPDQTASIARFILKNDLVSNIHLNVQHFQGRVRDKHFKQGIDGPPWIKAGTQRHSNNVLSSNHVCCIQVL